MDTVNQDSLETSVAEDNEIMVTVEALWRSFLGILWALVVDIICALWNLISLKSHGSFKYL